MSAQIHALLDEERAREPAIAPCPAMPKLTEEQMAGQDEMGEHLDCEVQS